MKTFFVWLKPGQNFDETQHQSCDIDIFKLIISQDEGELAVARVVTSRQTKIPSPSIMAAMAMNHENKTTLLFQGRLSGFPQILDAHLMELSFLAEPLDGGKNLKELCQKMKQGPLWDPLFVHPSEVDNPRECLEAGTDLFCWDRLSGKVNLSSIFKGAQTLTFSNQILKGSLKIHMTHPPLDEVEVTLSCEWMQQVIEEINVAPLIHKQFKSGMMNTLMPSHFMKHWPKPYTKLGQSGYWVFESSLQEISPPQTAALNIYPRTTPPFRMWDLREMRVKETRLRRAWFKAKLVVGWFYQQKRREKIKFSLKQMTPWGPSHRKKTLNLTLQSLPESEKASFFLTDRGRQAFEHALERAKSHLAASGRCLEVEACVPYEAGLAFSLDHSVIIQDPLLPHGHIEGKVISYRLIQDKSGSCAWFKMAVPTGFKSHEIPMPEGAAYCTSHYGVVIHPAGYKTPSGLIYKDYSHQKPTQGWVNPSISLPHEIIESLHVENQGEAQISWLLKNQYPVLDDPLKGLQDFPTRFSMKLKDIRTESVLEHTIHAEVLSLWSAT